MISEVQGALRKGGGFVFGNRLPFLVISTCGTFSLRHPKKGAPTRRQGETALTHIKFFRVTGSELASLRPFRDQSWDLARFVEDGCYGGVGGLRDTCPG